MEECNPRAGKEKLNVIIGMGILRELSEGGTKELRKDVDDHMFNTDIVIGTTSSGHDFTEVSMVAIVYRQQRANGGLAHKNHQTARLVEELSETVQ